MAAAALLAAGCTKSASDEPQKEQTIEWGGETYKVVTLSNGQTWFAENLRFVPDGATISDDPKDGSGIWYPIGADGKADKSDSLIKANGLFYSYAKLFGAEELTVDNVYNYENCQGLCPEGWHVPSRSEWVSFVGHADVCYDKDGNAVAAVDDSTAIPVCVRKDIAERRYRRRCSGFPRKMAGLRRHRCREGMGQGDRRFFRRADSERNLL